jgi:hypothetical protein
MTRSPAGVARPLRINRRSALDLGLVVAAIAVIGVIVKVVWREFTFFGDNAESFFPLWHMYGTALRAGEPFLFDPNGWGAGNVMAEAAYGVFNPVTIVNAILISFSDRLTIAGFLVMLEFLVLLGCGVYLLARSYGASRTASVLVGVIAPFAGYTLYYEASNWASGLMSVVWVVHFWWAARMFSQSRIGPLLPFVFGFLAATVGNPYSVVGILVVLFSLGLERALLGEWRRFGGLVLVGGLIGTAVVLTYAGLLATLTVIDRPVGGDLVSNKNYLTPTLSDMLGMSSSTYLPRIQAWFGGHDLVPSSYLSWLVLPLLPWIRWRSIPSWRPNMSVLIAGLVVLVLTLGPDHLWLFRWPIRFIEYLYICVLVVFAIALSAGLARTRLAARTALSLAAVGVSLYLAFSSRPTLTVYHLVVAAVSVVLVIGIRLTVRSARARHWLLAIAVAGTAVITPFQAQLFGWSHQSVEPGVDQSPPSDLSIVRDAWKDVDGRVLQIGELKTLYGTDAVATGQLVFGNIGSAAGIDMLNRYTGINFEAFKDGLGFDYRGTVGPYFPISNLWTSVSPDHPVQVVDALGIDTLVISKTRPDLDTLDEMPPGWKVTEDSEYRLILTRTAPITHPALSPLGDVEVTGAEASGTDMTFRVSSDEGGSVIVDRLGWPGYTIALDGEPLETETIPYGLIEVHIPAESSGLVTVTYEAPGLRLGGIVAAAGLLGAVAYQVVWWVRRRRDNPAEALAEDRAVVEQATR